MGKLNTEDANVQGGEADDRLNAKIQEAIGRSLRAHYEDLIHAPIPDKFLELLARLELQERKSRSQGKE
jgi:Anti-sigma factor NepR